jgi:hypothetical protein
MLIKGASDAQNLLCALLERARLTKFDNYYSQNYKSLFVNRRGKCIITSAPAFYNLTTGR